MIKANSKEARIAAEIYNLIYLLGIIILSWCVNSKELHESPKSVDIFKEWVCSHLSIFHYIFFVLAYMVFLYYRYKYVHVVLECTSKIKSLFFQHHITTKTVNCPYIFDNSCFHLSFIFILRVCMPKTLYYIALKI